MQEDADAWSTTWNLMNQVVTWGDEMYGGNCRAQKDQLKDVQQLQVSRWCLVIWRGGDGGFKTCVRWMVMVALLRIFTYV